MPQHWAERVLPVPITKNDSLLPYAKRLRREMTEQERKLWYRFLRSYPVKIYKQRIIESYIVDFYCASAKLVIEIDGSQHYEESGKEQDERRDDALKRLGLTVLRLSNREIDHAFDAVCEKIDQMIREGTPSQSLRDSSPKGGAYKEKESMKTVTIYTDGACSGNPGPGGWGAILRYGAHEKELSGGEAMTTNNRMELTAVIQALLALREPCVVELYSDSKYVIDALEKGWAWGWRKKGWVKSDKKPALNPDLWALLLDLTRQHDMRYHWVKGHADNEYNERCDALAVAARERLAKD